MGANIGKSGHNSHNVHYVYIYGIKESMPDISKELISFIAPNIELIESIGVQLQIFYLSDNDIKDSEIHKLLSKNNITKLPALKIKQKNKKNNQKNNQILHGNNQIIDYYAQLLGNDFLKNKKNYDIMQQRYFLEKKNNLSKFTPQSNQLTTQVNQLTPQYNNQLTPQYNNQLTPQYNNQLTPQYNNQLMPNNEIKNGGDSDDEAINSTKDMMHNFDKLVKQRSSMNKNLQKKIPSSQNLQNSQNSQNSQKKSTSKSYLENSFKEDLPFREGELDELLNDGSNDDLNDNLSDNLNDDKISFFEALKKNSNKKPENKFMLGDDDDNNDENQDLIMQSAFWDKVS
jgi:hypothetical protein